MATLFDISLLQSFSSVFTILLVWTVIFAILQLTNIFKDNKSINAIIAFVVAMLFAFSPKLTAVLTTMTPWFVVVIMFFFFIWMLGRFLGLANSDLIAAMGNKSGAFWWVFSFAVIILIYSLSSAFGQDSIEEGAEGNVSDTGFAKNIKQVFTHPKVLGAVIILVIASFAVRLIANPDPPMPPMG